MFALSPYTHTLIRGRKEKGRKKRSDDNRLSGQYWIPAKAYNIGPRLLLLLLSFSLGAPQPICPAESSLSFLILSRDGHGKRDGGENANFQLFFRDRLSRSAPKPFCSGFVVWFLLRERLAAEQKTFPYVMPPSEPTFFFFRSSSLYIYYAVYIIR